MESSSSTVVLPGTIIPVKNLPLSETKKLKLGPGLLQYPDSSIRAIVTGALAGDARKNAIWIDYAGGRYAPTAGDQVVVTVNRSTGEHYQCSITPNTTPALLPHLAFENATKKTRPMLDSGALVYARVSAASRHVDTSLECLNPATNKADGLGVLKGGMVWHCSLGYVRRLSMGKRGGVVLLDELSKTLAFELAIGKNGVVWVNGGENLRVTLAVGRAILEVDERGLDQQQQVELARRVLKSL